MLKIILTHANSYWVNYKSIVNKHIKWTEEWMIDRWERKQKVYSWYEKELRKSFLNIFDKEEKDIMKEFEKNGYWKSISYKELRLKLNKRYYAVYQLYLKDVVKEIVKSEWDRALDELDSNKAFQYNEKVAKKVKDMITQIAKEVDSVTDNNLLNAIWKATDEWLSPSEIKDAIQWVFEDLKTERLDKIIRTESIRYWTYAEQEAWNQSWVVKYKQRWTGFDERTCESCWKITLKENSIKWKICWGWLLGCYMISSSS